MLEDFFCDNRPFFTLFYLEFELGESYLDEGKFTGYKKRIECNQSECYDYTETDAHTGVRIHISYYTKILYCATVGATLEIVGMLRNSGCLIWPPRYPT